MIPKGTEQSRIWRNSSKRRNDTSQKEKKRKCDAEKEQSVILKGNPQEEWEAHASKLQKFASPDAHNAMQNTALRATVFANHAALSRLVEHQVRGALWNMALRRTWGGGSR